MPVSEQEEFEFRARAEREAGILSAPPKAKTDNAAPHQIPRLEAFGRPLGYIPNPSPGERTVGALKGATGTVANMLQGAGNTMADYIEHPWDTQARIGQSIVDTVSHPLDKAAQFAKSVRGMSEEQLGETAGSAAVSAIPGEKVAQALKFTRPSVREMIRGKTNVAANVAEQARAGVTNPSPGTVTGNKMLRGTEALQSHLPGSAGVSKRAAEQRTAGMGAKVSSVADRLSPGGSSNEIAGRATTTGIDRFIEKFKAKQNELYGAVKRHINPAKPIELPEFTTALQGLTKSVKGAEATSASLVNDKVRQLFEDLKSDTNAQVQPTKSIIQDKSGPLIKPPTATVRSMPYEAVDVVRQRIGQLLDDKLVSDYPKSQLKKLYGALTTDIENGLGKGTPARKAWDRARDYTRAGRDRIDNVLQPIADKATPEQSLRAALSGTKEGATTFRRTMRSLPVKEANTVRANVIEKMGKATAGAQDVAGERFSVDTFMTNWNNLHADAKKVLFADPKIRADMENIAKVANKYKEAGRDLYNPSGSGRVVGHAAVAVEALREFMSGNFTQAGAIASVPAVNWAAARAMNSPKFIEWLSGTTKAKPIELPGRYAQLQIMAQSAKTPDEKKSLMTLSQYFNGGM